VMVFYSVIRCRLEVKASLNF